MLGPHVARVPVLIHTGVGFVGHACRSTHTRPMFKILKAVRVLKVDMDRHTMGSSVEINVPATFMGGLLVFMLVRLTHLGFASLATFPKVSDALVAGIPRGPVGPTSPSSLVAGVVFDGPEGSVSTTTSFALQDVMLQLTLAVIEWDTECVAASHFGTRVPLSVFRFVAEDPGWVTSMTSLVKKTSPRLARWEYSVRQQLEAASDAAASGVAPWFDVRMLLAGNLTSPAVARTRFLAVANLRCTQQGTAHTRVGEAIHNCPRNPDGSLAMVTHKRWNAVQCSGDLVSPNTPGTTTHTTELVFHGFQAACAQNALDVLHADPGLCTSDPE